MDIQTLSAADAWEWPQNAAAVIRETLQNANAPMDDRLLAAEMSGDLVVMSDDMAQLLLSIVLNTNEPEELRAHAAIALGPALEIADDEDYEDEYADPPISQNMFDVLKDALRSAFADETIPKLVRRRVLEASVRAAQDWHAAEVRKALASPDADWRLTAVFCMRHVRGFENEILRMLNDRDRLIHEEAIAAAAACELREAWPHVSSLLTTKGTDRELLLAAIEASPYIHPDEAKLLLIDFAESEDQEISEAALEALAVASPELDDEEDEEEED